MVSIVKKKKGIHPKVRIAAANGLAKLNVQTAKEILKKMADQEKNKQVKTAFTSAYNKLNESGKVATPDYGGTPSYYGTSEYYGSGEYYGSYGY